MSRRDMTETGGLRLTQPVALNILRSSGSPESSPSSLVREWQQAMPATNAVLTRPSLAGSSSGGEKLEAGEKINKYRERERERERERGGGGGGGGREGERERGKRREGGRERGGERER